MDRKHYDDYLAKFNTRDHEGVLGYYAGDFEIVFAGFRLRGRDELLRFYGFFHRYVRESIAVDRFVSDEHTLVIEARVRLECFVDLSPETLAEAGFPQFLALPKGAVVEMSQFIHYHVEGGKFTKAWCAVFQPPV